MDKNCDGRSFGAQEEGSSVVNPEAYQLGRGAGDALGKPSR